MSTWPQWHMRPSDWLLPWTKFNLFFFLFLLFFSVLDEGKYLAQAWSHAITPDVQCVFQLLQKPHWIKFISTIFSVSLRLQGKLVQQNHFLYKLHEIASLKLALSEIYLRFYLDFFLYLIIFHKFGASQFHHVHFFPPRNSSQGGAATCAMYFGGHDPGSIEGALLLQLVDHSSQLQGRIQGEYPD